MSQKTTEKKQGFFTGDNKRKWIIVGGAGLFFVVALTIVLVFTLKPKANADKIVLPMPNFVGAQYSDVVNWAKENDLTIAIRYQNNDQPSGIILDQNISPDSEAYGQTLIITLSKGNSLAATGGDSATVFKIPDFTGKGQTDVETWIAQNDKTIVLESTFIFDNTIAKDVLISWSPADEIKTGATLSVVISKGKPTLTDFTGQPYSDYAALLNQLNAEGAQLIPDITYSYSNTIAKDRVISQDIGDVNVGASVKVVVSLGPTSATVKVGQYTGFDYTKLPTPIPSGLLANFVGGPCEIGNITGCAGSNADINRVYYQSIVAETVVNTGTSIEIRYFIGMAMPDYVGKSFADVVGPDLNARGFTQYQYYSQANTTGSGPTEAGVVWKVADGNGAVLAPGNYPLTKTIKIYVNPTDNLPPQNPEEPPNGDE
ncbi:MAG: PASTA domain-containing protein [Erysipelotrichaceae bacterium]|nr:PASTA domain-containing protein [Erysipelotrichaceae bacterium]